MDFCEVSRSYAIKSNCLICLEQKDIVFISCWNKDKSMIA